MNIKLIIVYPCLNGGHFILAGHYCEVTNKYSNKTWVRVSGGKVTEVTYSQVKKVMKEEGFFEVMPWEAPQSISGVIYT